MGSQPQRLFQAIKGRRASFVTVHRSLDRLGWRARKAIRSVESSIHGVYLFCGLDNLVHSQYERYLHLLYSTHTVGGWPQLYRADPLETPSSDGMFQRCSSLDTLHLANTLRAPKGTLPQRSSLAQTLCCSRFTPLCGCLAVLKLRSARAECDSTANVCSGQCRCWQ